MKELKEKPWQRWNLRTGPLAVVQDLGRTGLATLASVGPEPPTAARTRSEPPGRGPTTAPPSR